MKVVLYAAVLALFASTAMAHESSGRRLRLADATTDACLASCSTQNASCQRVCPVTLSVPCISSCEAQAQTCRQGCRK